VAPYRTLKSRTVKLEFLSLIHHWLSLRSFCDREHLFGSPWVPTSPPDLPRGGQPAPLTPKWSRCICFFSICCLSSHQPENRKRKEKADKGKMPQTRTVRWVSLDS
jgi:hypothetical protein